MNSTKNNSLNILEKCPTGINGLDQITYGGLPKGRPILVCGGTGCGKSLFSLEFLYRGATEFNEPGVFVSFEETSDEIIKNVASLGFDIPSLINKKKLFFDHVKIERADIEETGEYDLEGLFIRLSYAIDVVKAKRVVLDTIEVLFAGLSNQLIIRSELKRLFRWLKEKGVTAVITGEQGEGTLTRHGLEEYVSDCVIFLDHRIVDQVSIRRLRVIKYRGSSHGSNEYPFLIDRTGFTVLPISSIGLKHRAGNKRVSSGIPKLDEMLGGKGYYEGSSIMVSGTAGTGKTSIAAHFADSVCRNGGKVLYLAYEESPDQVVRNMKSIGIDLKKWIDKKQLIIHSSRATEMGLEMHLVSIHKKVEENNSQVVILDPVTSFDSVGTEKEIKSMLMRIVDMMKTKNITLLMLSLRQGNYLNEASETEISSIIDTWIMMRNIESAGEKNRGIYILKSRGMAHSNQINEFIITSNGIELIEPYIGKGQILTGAARKQQENLDKSEKLIREQELEHRRYALESKRKALEAKISALKSEFEAEEREISLVINQNKIIEQSQRADMQELARKRGVNIKLNGDRRK